MFEIEAYPNDLSPDAMRVELYTDGVERGAPIRQEMKRVRSLPGEAPAGIYTATLSATREVANYTALLIPYCANVAIPMEGVQMPWQR